MLLSAVICQIYIASENGDIKFHKATSICVNMWLQELPNSHPASDNCCSVLF